MYKLLVKLIILVSAQLCSCQVLDRFTKHDEKAYDGITEIGTFDFHTTEECAFKCLAESTCLSFISLSIDTTDNCAIYDVSTQTVPPSAYADVALYDLILTPAPTPGPTFEPSPNLTPAPTAFPTSIPSPVVTPIPTQPPTVSPTAIPTPVPTSNPSPNPTPPPTPLPTTQPTPLPTHQPSPLPTIPPTPNPTSVPSPNPTLVPSPNPSSGPTPVPTIAPSPNPTEVPTPNPTLAPTSNPTVFPTPTVTSVPSLNPSTSPTPAITSIPTLQPTTSPSSLPSDSPSIVPTPDSTSIPSSAPSSLPSDSPTQQPSDLPTVTPTTSPSSIPTLSPSQIPTIPPTILPTILPTTLPTTVPTSSPSLIPSNSPTLVPTYLPVSVTTIPTSIPSMSPTTEPSDSPTLEPSLAPTGTPTADPSSQPAPEITDMPSLAPTTLPTAQIPDALGNLTLVSCVPFVVPYFGNITVKCQGLNFLPGMLVYIAEILAESVSVISYKQISQETSVTFAAPSLSQSDVDFKSGGFVDVLFVNAEPDSQQFLTCAVLSYVSLDATENDCIGEGMWWTTSECLQCPQGGTCPGGDMMWPQKGYWSTDPYTSPEECATDVRCPGAQIPPKTQENVDYAATNCNFRSAVCAQEYQGELCAGCSDGFYSAGKHCLSCDSLPRDVNLLPIVLISILLVLLVAAAILVSNDRWIGILVFGIIIVQQFAMLGAIAAPSLSPTAAKFFYGLNLLNFELQSSQLECQTSSNFFDLFWMLLIIVMLAAVIFIGAAIVRQQLAEQGRCMWGLRDVENFDEEVYREEGLKWRLLHTFLILVSIFYLALSQKAVTAVHCAEFDGQLQLAAHPDISCWVGEHIVVVVLAWLILIVVTLTMPILLLRSLKNAHKKNQHSMEKSAKFGFLYCDAKDRVYWFRWLYFALSFSIAVGVAIKTVSGSMFLPILVFVVAITVVALLQPFKLGLLNIFHGAATIVCILEILIIMGIVTENADVATSENDAIFYTSIVVVWVAVILIILCWASSLWKGRDASVHAPARENILLPERVNTTPRVRESQSESPAATYTVAGLGPGLGFSQGVTPSDERKQQESKTNTSASAASAVVSNVEEGVAESGSETKNEPGEEEAKANVEAGSNPVAEGDGSGDGMGEETTSGTPK